MKIFKYKNGVLDSSHIRIMGILNVTPDSFSDGGLYFDSSSASAHAFAMINDGADIIDIGAMSTRPGSEKIPPESEIDRLERVLYSIRERSSVIISVDTYYPQTADFALENGADIINDVSGVFNRDMAAVIRKHGAGWVLMHSRVSDAGNGAVYPDGVCADISRWFSSVLSECERAGISRDNICLDPGYGFGKNTQENMEILKNTRSLVPDDVMFLTALSRKRFIGDITLEREAFRRDPGTLAADMLACISGSDMLRVHDVKSTRDMVRVFEAWRDING